jgi:hypothetical protein
MYDGSERGRNGTEETQSVSVQRRAVLGTLSGAVALGTAVCLGDYSINLPRVNLI